MSGVPPPILTIVHLDAESQWVRLAPALVLPFGHGRNATTPRRPLVLRGRQGVSVAREIVYVPEAPELMDGPVGWPGPAHEHRSQMDPGMIGTNRTVGPTYEVCRFNPGTSDI